MKQILLLISLVLFADTAISQGAYTYKPKNVIFSLTSDSSIMNMLASSPGFEKLSSFEKEFIYYLNFVRKHPKQFNKQALVPFLEAYPMLNPNYGESLSTQLNGLSSLPGFSVDLRLVKIARLHATDLAANDIMSHQSSNGTTTQQRFEKAGVGCGSECINLARDTNALNILLSLLIDFNVPSLGHRKTLLNPKMTTVGVGESVNSKSQMHYTVVDVGCQ